MDRASLGKYLLSLPERALRSASALAGGLVREIGNVTLPAAVRRTTLYRTMVEATLRFLIEEVGQVEGVYPPAGVLAHDFLFRKAAGHGIDWIGILAFRASPVWVMAALADLSGTGRQLIREISETLHREGLLTGESHFETVDQLLDGLEQSAAQITTVLNAPPLRVADLRAEWQLLRENVSKIPQPHLPSGAMLQASWDKLLDEAHAQQRPVFQIASMMAVAAIAKVPENLLWLTNVSRRGVQRTGELFAESLLDHYTATLHDMQQQGLAAWWAREFNPYLRAAADQFSRRRVSLTQRLLRSRGVADKITE